MARPQQDGHEYYNVNIGMLKDFKFKKAAQILDPEKSNRCLVATMKICVFELLDRIYGDKGYYMHWDEYNAVTIADEINSNQSEVNAIVLALLEVDFFSKEKFEQYHILTSNGIQKRHATVKKISRKMKTDEQVEQLFIPGYRIGALTVTSAKRELRQEKPSLFQEKPEFPLRAIPQIIFTLFNNNKSISKSIFIKEEKENLQLFREKLRLISDKHGLSKVESELRGSKTVKKNGVKQVSTRITGITPREMDASSLRLYNPEEAEEKFWEPEYQTTRTSHMMMRYIPDEQTYSRWVVAFTQVLIQTGKTKPRTMEEYIHHLRNWLIKNHNPSIEPETFIQQHINQTGNGKQNADGSRSGQQKFGGIAGDKVTEFLNRPR